jgi:predicted ATPase
VSVSESRSRALTTPATATVGQRLKLQNKLGQALIWSKGYGAKETKAAFAQAKELAAGVSDTAERFATYYGLWVGNLLRAELVSAQQTAENFLQQAKAERQVLEVAVVSRNLGVTRLYQGAPIEARAHLEEALRNYDPDRDGDAKIHFAQDHRASSKAFLARVLWVLGDIGNAQVLAEEAVARGVEAAHPPTLANVLSLKAQVEILRGDAPAAQRSAQRIINLAQEHSLALMQANAAVYAAWARAELGGLEAGRAELRLAIAAYIDQGNRLYVPWFQGLLAELDADADNFDEAWRGVDEALMLAGETGEHWTDAFLHRVQGEILFKREPANTAPAEKALLTAIAIAQQQKARTFELRAALSLATLYQSTGRPADAHAALAPALEGFSPTLEFPEIKAARTLLAALAQTEDVKKDTALRQRRFRLQTAYSNALLHGRGMSPPETTAAFAKARELATSIEDPAERFPAYYGLWVGPFIRGNLPQMREVAEAFMRDAERSPTLPEAGIAHRLLGTTCWYAGDYTGAQVHLEQALARYDHARDLHLASSFAYDQGAVADFYLGMTLYALGETGRGARLVEDALRLALHGQHIPTVALAHHYIVVFAAVRHSLDQATAHAEALLELGTTHGLPSWRGFANFTLAWAARRHNPRALVEMRAALALQREMNFRTEQALLGTLLAEAEAEAGELDAALATVEEQLAAIEQTGERWFAAEVNRAHAEILLKRDPANSAAAEQAFLTAIAIAQQQKAKSFELRAALSLARLYQSSGRAADAHAVLTRALRGFSLTPEFPEVAQAQTLLAGLVERI